MPESTGLRQRLPDLVRGPAAAHAGLVLDRYVSASVGAKEHPEARQVLYQAACQSTANALAVYREAFARRLAWCRQWNLCADGLSPGGTPPSGPAAIDFELGTPPHGRLVIGLGSQSPLETGLTLHRTYGVPVIPGSAVKGLAAHYCDRVLGEADPALKRGHRTVTHDDQGRQSVAHGMHRAVFGDTDDAGLVTFHDAWITPGSFPGGTVVADVMTPHHADYYGQRKHAHGQRQGQVVPPTDFDDPTPVAFLSVRGTFHFLLTCTDASDDGRRLLGWVADVVRAAIQDWGIGGKTSSGYGRLVPAVAHAGGPVPQEPTEVLPSVDLPKPGQTVEAELLAEKTRRGGWRAKHLDTGIAGPVQNSDQVPADHQPGARVRLIVAAASAREIAFRYPTATETNRAQQPPRQDPRNKDRKGGGQRR
jgi:CRISPR-associated protein Cmr6